MLIIHAPSVHSGGGMTLLRSILSIPNLKIKLLQLDSRGVQTLHLSRDVFNYHSYHASVWDRLRAEFRLWINVKSTDVVLCFHGLPPLLPLKGQIVVFIQNRILLENELLEGYPFLTKVRLTVERCWLRFFHQPNYRYIVQTPSMQIALQKLWKDADVSVLPFAPVFETQSIKNEFQHEKNFDFLYIASGEAHKNHLNLLEAWRILAGEDLKPTLALTVSTEAFPKLCAEITKYTKEHGLYITNLNLVESSKIHTLYQSASALIFPSTTESFGLPLIEAKQFGMPILASELDYVRDVVEPVETFNPSSPVSIARAVKRFMGCKEDAIKVKSAKEFLEEILA
jgi:glycosyltransferase involved in cell wall biosynthesis